MSSITANEPKPFEIARRFETFTAGFPWECPLAHANDPIENLWRYYNVVFTVASHRPLRTSIAVMEAGLVMETLLPLRTHLELLGIQRYLAIDKRRVVTFAERGAQRQQQLIERARRLGHGDANDWSALARRASQDLNRLRKHTLDAEFIGRAEEMLKSSGFDDDVDGVLRVADNWVDMNAAALDYYAHGEPGGRLIVDIGPDTQGAAMLLNAVRYHYAITALTNEVLHLGQEAPLRQLWAEFTAIYGESSKETSE